MKSDPAYTDVQAGFTAGYRNQIKRLMEAFLVEVLPHLEWGAADPSRVVGPDAVPKAMWGIPLIHYRTEERFREIPVFARSLGVYVGNTHTVTLTEVGPEQTSAHIVLKHDVAPRGLMTPGKMKAFPVNPFEPASAQAPGRVRASFVPRLTAVRRRGRSQGCCRPGSRSCRRAPFGWFRSHPESGWVLARARAERSDRSTNRSRR